MAPHPRTPSIFRHNSSYFESVSDPLAIPGRPLSPSSRNTTIYSDTTDQGTTTRPSAASTVIAAAAMLNPNTVAFEVNFMIGDAAAFLENLRSSLVVAKVAQEEGIKLVNEAENKHVALSSEIDWSEGTDSDVHDTINVVAEQAKRCRRKYVAKVDKSWDNLDRLKAWKWYVAEWVGALEELVAAFESMWEQVEAADAEYAWDYEDDKEALIEHVDEIWGRVVVAERGAKKYAAVPAKGKGKKRKGKVDAEDTMIDVRD